MDSHLSETLRALATNGQRENNVSGEAMPMMTTDDGVKLYYEDTGTGDPILFCMNLVATI